MLKIFEFEVEAKRAMFGRVDSTSSLSQSYPIPTPTAIEGLCTSIVGIHKQNQAVMRAEYVKVCSSLQTDMETTNAYCVSRKQDLINKDAAQQCRKVFLVNQRWIFGVRGITSARGTNNDKAIQSMFERYVNEFKQVKSPSCGHSEMFPTYIGPVRPETQINKGFTMIIPDFLIRTFKGLIDGKFDPFYAESIKVDKGFFDYYECRKVNNVL